MDYSPLWRQPLSPARHRRQRMVASHQYRTLRPPRRHLRPRPGIDQGRALGESAMEMIDSFFPFAATTGSITVRVAVSYLPEQSHPALGRWFWAYHVRVENHGEDAVQLISRHWRISDGRGQTSEVRSEEHTSELQSL